MRVKTLSMVNEGIDSCFVVHRSLFYLLEYSRFCIQIFIVILFSSLIQLLLPLACPVESHVITWRKWSSVAWYKHVVSQVCQQWGYCSLVLSYCHDNAYYITMVEFNSNFELNTDIPYLTLMFSYGFLIQYIFWENTPCYDETRHVTSVWYFPWRTVVSPVLMNRRHHSFVGRSGMLWDGIHGLVQDCSLSSALALEILQSYTKPLICV